MEAAPTACSCAAAALCFGQRDLLEIACPRPTHRLYVLTPLREPTLLLARARRREREMATSESVEQRAFGVLPAPCLELVAMKVSFFDRLAASALAALRALPCACLALYNLRNHLGQINIRASFEFRRGAAHPRPPPIAAARLLAASCCRSASASQVAHGWGEPALARGAGSFSQPVAQRQLRSGRPQLS